MKKIFITGASGFVGKNIVEQLKGKYIFYTPSSADLNLTDKEQVDIFFKDKYFDVLIHGANIGGARKGDSTDALNRNLQMFNNLIAHRSKFGKMIQFGSGAEYDKSKDIISVQEEQLDHSNPKDEYGLSKKIISEKIKLLPGCYSLKIFGLYGKYEDYDYKFISNTIIKKLLNLPVEIVQNAKFEYVYIDDFIKIIEWFIENEPRYQVYNIGSNNKIDLLSLAKIIDKNVDENCLINFGFNKEYTCDATRLLNEVKIKFTSHEKAIGELVKYYQSLLPKIDVKSIKEDKYISKIVINKEEDTKSEKQLREEILERVKEIYQIRNKEKKFIPGVSKVHYSGRVFDEREMVALVDSSLDFWLTLGEKGQKFCNKFAETIGVRKVMVTNSGSSSNLIAVTALCSPNLPNHLKPGDEIITTAMTFPTTLTPIIQNNLVPVFVDIEEDTYNIDASKIENAISPKTRAIMFAHTLGNPAEMDKIMEICKKHNLFLIEDTCDALDSKYDGKFCGSFGDFATFSFYAAHHITMGEGGAVATNSLAYYKTALSIRDWGRACYCETGEANPSGACNNRFNFKFPGLPNGYDHKYIYNNLGYNLKPLDIQCAIGIEQIDKLPSFTQKRKENFAKLYKTFANYKDKFILPRALPKSEPSWFAFPLTVKVGAPFSKYDFVTFLEKHQIETRMLFAGNILKQPGFKNINHRISGDLRYTDQVLERTFFIGLYPGMDEERMNYMIKIINSFFE